MKRKKEIVKINESRLRNMITESVKGILNEIGDTPAGQWMLGRLAGRQRNRELGIDRKSEWSRNSGKIKNTTTDAENYASDTGYGGDSDTYNAFWKGYNSENYDWYDDTDQYGEYDDRQHKYNERDAAENSAYGDAMASMIRHHSNKALKESKANKNIKKDAVKINENALRKMISESIKAILSENYFDDKPMRAKMPSRVMSSADMPPGYDELANPCIPSAKQVRSATNAAYKMNLIVKKFVYEVEEGNESWTIDSLAQEIFSRFSRINGFQYGEPHVYEFTIEDIRKRLQAYVKKVRNNLYYFEEKREW